MIKRSPRGRIATAHAYAHLDIAAPAVASALF
jgi:Holliday junction resolvasome RuvABC ATP-dependent DNA helicase subunit